ncbi:MAG: hypothetical protein IKE53_07575 [Clostridiales bacterium]|nr:hypothetical protein [Clostridiales bacterium]
MACFLVPAAEAAVVTIATKIAEAKGVNPDGFVKKTKWLTNTLWGGSALLAFEHAWHGEIIPTFPFLTNAVDAADRAEMFHEMATVGVIMALLITAVWGISVAVTAVIAKRNKTATEASDK